MRQRLLGLLFGLCAAGMVQAQEVVDQLTIEVGADLDSWGYDSRPESLLGALIQPAPSVELSGIGWSRNDSSFGVEGCSVGLVLKTANSEQRKYLESIKRLKYGDFEFELSEGDGLYYLFNNSYLTVQQRSCAFANAVAAAYPQGSIVDIAIVREVADPLPPVIVPATLGVTFKLRAGYPSVVPAAGGGIRYSSALSNLSATGKPILYWISTQLSGGTGYRLLNPTTVTVTAAASLNEVKAFSVPAWFPAGNYKARLVAVDPATGEQVSAELAFSKSIN